MAENTFTGHPEDIIERLQQEIATAAERVDYLQNQESNLHQIIEKIPAPVAVLDSDLRFFAYSASYMKEFGITFDSLKDVHIHDVFPTIEKSWLEDIKTCLTGVIVGPNVKTLILSDGRKKWVTRSLFPLKNPSGNTVGIIVFHETTMGYDETKAAVKASELRFRTLAESTYEAIFISENGIGIDTNSRATEMFGYSRDEIIGMHGTTIAAPRDKELLKQRMLEGYEKPYEALLQRKDGTIFFAEIKGKNINYMGKNVRVSIVRDIDEEKKAQLELQQKEKQYRNMVENLNDIIYTTGPDGTISYISPVIEQVTSFTPDEMQGKRIIDLVHHDDRSSISTVFSKRLGQKRTECRLLHKNGLIRWVRISVHPIFRDTKIIEFNGVMTNITREKQAEQEQQRLESLLQRSKQLEVIGTLAGGVAHDLNNILSGIVSYPDLLLLDLEPDNPKRVIIETIKKSGERAAMVVQDLLTLARKDLTGVVALNCNELISEYLTSPETELFKTYHPKLQISFKPETNILPINGSPVHLKKIIMNLVHNAAEAMPAGGDLVISTRNKYLEKYIVQSGRIPEGQYVEISIKDSGVGINQNDLERIFEPFYSTKKMGRSGTGLGMAVVWSSIQDHKGYIDITSTLGTGTTVQLYFPVNARSINARINPHQDINDLQGQGELILLVDDLKEQLEIGAGILKKLGYQTKTVSSGEDAVSYLKDNHADLVILDMIMDPGQDGLETYQQIIASNPDQNTIIASGYAETDRVRKAIELGIKQFIKKPYSLTDIGLAVKNTLKKSALSPNTLKEG